MEEKRIKVGLIGLGRMGRFYLKEMLRSGKWDVAYLCDVDPDVREEAQSWGLKAQIVVDDNIIFDDPTVEVVGLFTLADQRLRQIRKAVDCGKHILAEKPISDSIEGEWQAVQLAESGTGLAAVNLYLRNSWYHHQMKQFINDGEIGELAIIRICHMTPGLAPGEGHEYEGPAFHDCGMHYVDIARWYAGCEYQTWHAQGIRMWDYKDPWWVQCHGTFENGVVFDITQGFVYGQLSKDQTHNSYVDIIGTKGIVRMTHDFKTAVVELRGVTRTERIEKPYGGKNIDVLCNHFANCIRQGRLDENLPTFRDSAIASSYAWKFLDNAMQNALPAIGDLDTLEEIRARRSTMTNGYGLLRAAKKKEFVL